jgi:MFS transporter, ACS family, tartrate transporter
MSGALGDPLMLHSDLSGEVRRRALSKVAWRFPPILTIAYVLNYLDRTSVGFAALTMNRDLGLSAYEFGWGTGL